MSEAHTADWNAVKLEKRHKRNKFDCGRASLDTYLHRRAGQDARRHVAAPFVVCDDDDQVIGYYTLSALSVDVDGLAEETARQLPKYPEVPAILLGRLAVDRPQQGNGLGRRLLIDALFRAHSQAAQIGAWAVIVEAIDDEAAMFYQRYGFKRFRDCSKRLFLPMSAIAKL